MFGEDQNELRNMIAMQTLFDALSWLLTGLIMVGRDVIVKVDGVEVSIGEHAKFLSVVPVKTGDLGTIVEVNDGNSFKIRMFNGKWAGQLVDMNIGDFDVVERSGSSSSSLQGNEDFFVAIFDATNSDEERRAMVQYVTEQFNMLAYTIHSITQRVPSFEKVKIMHHLWNQLVYPWPDNLQKLGITRITSHGEIDAGRVGSLQSYVLKEDRSDQKVPVLVMEGRPTVSNLRSPPESIVLNFAATSDPRTNQLLAQLFKREWEGSLHNRVGGPPRQDSMEIDLFFLESICDDEDMLWWNYRSKITNQDFAPRKEQIFMTFASFGTNQKQKIFEAHTMAMLAGRTSQYKKRYVPLSLTEHGMTGVDYLKITDCGRAWHSDHTHSFSEARKSSLRLFFVEKVTQNIKKWKVTLDEVMKSPEFKQCADIGAAVQKMGAMGDSRHAMSRLKKNLENISGT